MKFVSKLRKFLNVDRRQMHFFMEALLYLGWARILLLFLPFSKLAPTLGTYMSETPSVYLEEHEDVLFNVYNSIRIMCRHTFWESKCFVRAIAAMKMLERRRIESTLYLGTTRDESGQMIAHAWLRCGCSIITGGEEMKRFTAVGKFAKTFSN